MSYRVLRYEVPVDDEWHRIETSGRDPLYVASRDPRVVEFWNRCDSDNAADVPAWFRVFGTGQPIDQGYYVGTAITAGGALVWHLFQCYEDPAATARRVLP